MHDSAELPKRTETLRENPVCLQTPDTSEEPGPPRSSQSLETLDLQSQPLPGLAIHGEVW